MATSTTRNQWAVEVVRGRDVGRHYPLSAGDTTIGNAPGAAAHVNLADQEGASPRRMAGKQACLIVSGEGLGIRDLDSPGGTFVNRQRLLAGQQRQLAPGDVIQVGGVQLVVKQEHGSLEPARATPPPVASARSGPMSAPYTFPGGSVCRTWDDFLVLAAQRWPLVRDELSSGRLTEHLRRGSHTDLLPRQEPGWTPDEVLDAWLGRLPSTRSSAPELDVHPETLVVRTGAAGGLIRQTLRITNVGYRLLRSTVQVESASPGRLRLASELNGKPIQTIDQTDLVVEIEVPETPGAATVGAVVISSNGGTKRVEVRVERPQAAAFADAASASDRTADGPSVGPPLVAWLSSAPLARRLWLIPLILVGGHWLVGLADRLPFGQSAGEPRLSALAALASGLGCLLGATLGARGGDRLDVAASGFTGAVAGLLVSALGFAAVRSVDGIIGSGGSSGFTAVVLWSLAGVGLALASWVAFPESKEGQV